MTLQSSTTANNTIVSGEKGSDTSKNKVPQSFLTFTHQPTELFEKNTLEIDTVVLTRHFIVTFGKNESGYRTGQVYNQSGRILGSISDCWGKEVDSWLRNCAGDNTIEFLALKRIFDSIEHKGFNFPPSEFEELHRTLNSKYHGTVYLRGEHFNQSQHVINKFSNVLLLQIPQHLYSEPDGRYIPFKTRRGTIGVYDTQDGSGKPLPLSDWKIKEWGDFEAVKPELKQFPFLEGFSDSLDGHLLPTGEHLASFRDNLLTIVQSSDLQRVLSDSCNGYACDPTCAEKLLYVNASSRYFNKVNLAQSSPTSLSVERTPIPFDGDITDLKFDPVGNFILCTVRLKDEDGSKLIVLDKNTMQVVAEHPDVWDTISVDSVGSIYYVDDNWHLRVVNTNLLSIPVGGLQAYEEQARERAAVKLKLASSITLPELPELPEGVTVRSTDPVEAIEAAIPKTLLERFQGTISACESISAVQRLEAQFDLLRRDNEFKDVPSAFSLVDAALDQKRRHILASDLATSLEALLTQLQSENASFSVRGLKKIGEELSAIRKMRGEIAIESPAQRDDIDSKILSCVTSLKNAHEAIRGTITCEIDALAKNITASIEVAHSLEEIHSIFSSEPYVLHVELVNSLQEKSERTRHRNSISEAVKTRTHFLEQEALVHAERDAEIAQESAEQAAELLEQLKAAVGKITNPSELKKFQTSPLLSAFNRISLGLSEADQTAAQASVATLLQHAGTRASAAHGLNKVKARGGYITIGQQRFLIAGDYSPMVSRVESDAVGQSEAEKLIFKDGFGRTYAAQMSLAGIPIDTKEYSEVSAKAFSDAVTYFKSLGRRVPEMRPTWRMTRHTQECLEKIVRELNIQRDSGQGILILEGEAGTGKNVLIDILASMASYERFMFACNYQTQKEDFTYEYAFSPEKGTYRVNAKLIEKLQTPYVINALDEINTLPPGVLKMLNALLDERRTLYLADGRELPMDPTSLLVGFMNPRNYVGTQELSREVISRASIVTIGYPPLKRKNKDGVSTFAPDEAIMLACCAPLLSDLSQEEFESVWNEEINKEGSALVQTTKDQKRQIAGLHKVVKIADAVRQQYTAYQTNMGREQMDFVFCLRTTTSIARRLTPDCNPLEVVKEVVLPKASDAETRKNLEFIIANT
jgi:MoxR-like ATPase